MTRTSIRKNFFGTDGIRSRVGIEPVTPETVVKLGWAAGRVLSRNSKSRAKVVIGKDTRVSGYLLESSLEAGLSAAGVDISLIGPLPTPGIAYLTRTSRAAAGIVISASHNPFYDNGIKFFSPLGFKLDDELELAIENKMQQSIETAEPQNLGKAMRFEDAAGRYIEYCKSTFPQKLSLDGVKIVIDCAHGAGYHVAPDVFEELGASVTAIGVQPNGFNINQGCGSTDLTWLKQTVARESADIGIALDGDGDRLMLVDAAGNEINGDQMLYLIAMHRQTQNELQGGIMGTVMTNLSLEHSLASSDIDFARSKVGDRYVLSGLQERGWLVGGETSGHIICLDKNTTGDGIIAALEVLSVMVSQERSLAELVRPLSLYPQNLINVRLDDGSKFDPFSSPEISSALDDAEQYLGERGRVVLRASGTEPLIRVMVEAQESQMALQVSQSLAQTVENIAKSRI